MLVTISVSYRSALATKRIPKIFYGLLNKLKHMGFSAAYVFRLLNYYFQIRLNFLAWVMVMRLECKRDSA